MKEYGGMPSDGVELHDSLEHLLLVPEVQYLATPAQVSHNHIRRIKIEDKANGIASVWGQNLFNSLPR